MTDQYSGSKTKMAARDQHEGMDRKAFMTPALGASTASVRSAWADKLCYPRSERKDSQFAKKS